MFSDRTTKWCWRQKHSSIWCMRICFVRGVCTDCVGRSLVSWHHIGRPFCCRTCIRVENNMRRNNVCVWNMCVCHQSLCGIQRAWKIYFKSALLTTKDFCAAQQLAVTAFWDAEKAESKFKTEVRKLFAQRTHSTRCGHIGAKLPVNLRSGSDGINECALCEH